MGLILGLAKRLIKLILYFTVFAGIVVLIPNLPPYTTFSSIKLDPTLPLTGPLALNDALNNAKQLYKEKLLGPEAFQIFNGELYTSLATGEIVKISPGGHVTFVTKVGQPCTGPTQEHICGRPLGFQIDEGSNTLYVADSYLGIWKVNLKTDKKQLLVSPNVAIEGRAPKLFNAILLAKNGDFYWTDSTSDFLLKDGAISLLTDPSGRFFYYNAAKNESKVLLDNLWFPNGLAFSPDKQFVLISETSRFRIVKYYIDGPKKGKSEAFINGLPGTPDNLRALPDGSGLLASLYVVFDNESPLLSRTMSETPLARKFLARLHRLVEIPFEYLHGLYPHVILEEIVYFIGHFSSVSRFGTGMSGLVHIDWNGNIVASYYNTDGSLSVSDAIVFGDSLYTGCPHNQDFIASVPAPPLLRKAFSVKKPETITKDTTKNTQQVPKETKKEEHKPKQEVPKMTKPVTTAPPTKKQAEKPKTVEDKPKPAVEKPKPVVEKPKPVAEKPKPVVEKPKPVAEKPKPVTEKPKPATEKPQPSTTPKPAQQQPKATEVPKVQPKGTTQEPKKTTPPPTAAPPKRAETKPTTKPMNAQEKPTETTTAKPAARTETKPVEGTNRGAKPETVAKPAKDAPKVTPEQIPIKEEITSDTAKPKKETLKVIKKGGPTEIPNINNV